MHTSQSALSFRLPLFGTRMIEASAGTGKTYTIAALYVRFILGDVEHYRDEHEDFSAVFEQSMTSGVVFKSSSRLPRFPMDILVVTFTKAAALELRERIRARLLEAVVAFRSEVFISEDVFLNELRTYYPPHAWNFLAYRLEFAAQSMDEAAIFTIHGFCRKMLSQFALESQQVFDLKTETDDLEHQRLAVRDYWRRFVVTLPEAFAGCIVECFGRNPDVLLDSFSELKKLNPQEIDAHKLKISFDFNKLSAIYDFFHQQIDPFIDLKKIWNRADYLNTLRNVLCAEHDSWNKTRFKLEVRERLIKCLELWLTGRDPLPNFSALSVRLKNNLSTQSILYFVNKKFQNDSIFQHEAFGALRELFQMLEQFEFALAFFPILHAFLWCHEAVKRLKSERTELGFDDMIFKLNHALSDENPAADVLKVALQKQYPVVLIDEFQDTDRLQYQIFHRIYGQPETQMQFALFMVGDPKQSIYAFRGAEMGTYLTARTHAQQFSKNEALVSLHKNFRSTRELVDGLNHLFSRAYQKNPALFGHEQIAYESIEAQGKSSKLMVNDYRLPAIQFAWLDQNLPNKPDNKAEYQRKISQAAAAQISLWLNADEPAYFEQHGEKIPIRPQDIAILVRSHTEATLMRTALRRLNIASVFFSEKASIWQSAEVDMVLAMLRAVAEPEQESLIRIALASPCFYWDLYELERLKDDDLFREAVQIRFQNYRHIWRKRGVLAMLQQLWFDEQLPSKCLANFGGERMLTNLRHVAELAQSYTRETEGEAGLIRTLERLALENEHEHQLYLETEKNLIRIVTIHSSKGLEYPIVMIPFASSLIAQPSKDQFLWRNDDGFRNFMLMKSASDDIKLQFQAQTQAEEMRLLYVALTRAVHHLWLGTSAYRGFFESSFAQLLGVEAQADQKLTAHDVQAIILSLCETFPTYFVWTNVAHLPCVYARSFDGALSTAVRKFHGKLSRKWHILSYSALAQTMTMRIKLPEMIEKRPPENGSNELSRRIDETIWIPTDAREAQLGDEGLSEWDAPDLNLAQPTRSLSLHHFHAGPQAGIFLHGLLEWVANTGFAETLNAPEELSAMLSRRCQRRALVDWIEFFNEWLPNFLQQPFYFAHKPFSFASLKKGHFLVELPFVLGVGEGNAQEIDAWISQALWADQARPHFEFQAMHGLFKGFIDFVFEHDGQFFVADYKSNKLGAGDEAYSAAAMRTVMLAHRYDVQGVMYLLALHRFLKQRRGAGYDYERDIGGAVFFFLRGSLSPSQGVFCFKPPRELIEALDQRFNQGRIK